MNMIVFTEAELNQGLPKSDRRVEHIRKILKKEIGDSLCAGIANGPVGTALIESYDGRVMRFAFTAESESAKLRPMALILGCPRPIQAVRILKDLASVGISEIIVSGTELGEKSYLQSDFYKNKEFERPLLEGAEQAGNPRLPIVTTSWTLERAVKSMGNKYPERIAFDPYKASSSFGRLQIESSSLLLAIGSERGWTDNELNLLTASGFRIATLGDRILKTETAAIVACSIALSKLGYL
jgi:16S rRNA (uracil1498-N3)-methyltransferase